MKDKVHKTDDLICAIPLTESTELYKNDLYSSSLNVILLLYMPKLVRSASNVGKVPTPVYFKHILASQLLYYKLSHQALIHHSIFSPYSDGWIFPHCLEIC
jgi:hypothetical protein